MINKALTTAQLGWIAISSIIIGGALGGFIGSAIQTILGIMVGLFWFAQAIRDKDSNKGTVVTKLILGILMTAAVNFLFGGFDQ